MHGGSRRGSHPARSKASGREARPRVAPVGPMPDAARLTRLLEPVLHALGMDLEGVRVASAGRRRILRITIDADGGVSLDDIAVASRELSARLDGSAEMGEQPYTLEVSSPGVDRPLTQPRHWRRAVGRLVEVPLAGQAADHNDGNGAFVAGGRIVATSEKGITLEQNGVLRDYLYADLGPGRVQVEFGPVDSETDEED